MNHIMTTYKKNVCEIILSIKKEGGDRKTEVSDNDNMKLSQNNITLSQDGFKMSAQI